MQFKDNHETNTQCTCRVYMYIGAIFFYVFLTLKNNLWLGALLNISYC